MGKDKRKRQYDEDDDSQRLKQLAKLMRGVKPKQRNKFHTAKKHREKSLREIAQEYNTNGELEDTD